VPEGPVGRLDKLLAAQLPEALGLSRSRVQALIAAGAVTVDGAQVTGPGTQVKSGARLCLALAPPRPSGILAEDLPLSVIYEDAELIIVDKPVGMVVHPAPGAPSGTLVNALLHHCGDSLAGIGGEERPGIVHRIDKDTSGLLVVAKSDRAHAGLSAQFAAHTVTRAYDALVWGAPSPGSARLASVAGTGWEGPALRIDAPIGRHANDRKKMAVRPRDGRRAVTRFWVEEVLAGGRVSRLTCRLETGRTHQIRVHGVHIGHPLLGDPVYGGAHRSAAAGLSPAARAALAALPGQALHARELGFDHPVSGAPLHFTTSAPASINTLLTRLRDAGGDVSD